MLLLVNHYMTPHPELVNILINKKCKVAFKDHKDKYMYLWIRYDTLTRNNSKQGLDAWGKSQSIFDKIASTVRRYYPLAELSSQDGRDSVVYKIVNNNPTPSPKPNYTVPSTEEIQEVAPKASKRK